jgi:hypothetical protein
MHSSAIVFGLIGVICLFFPDVLARLMGFSLSVKLLIQFIAAGFLAMAVLNWIGRNAIYGGIYGKPIALANFAFGLILTTSTFSAQIKYISGVWGWIVILLFGLYTSGFVKLIFFPGELDKSKT